MAYVRQSLGTRDHFEHYFRNMLLKVEFRCLQAGLPRGLVVRGLSTVENVARAVKVIP